MTLLQRTQMNTANKGSSYASALLTPVCLQLSPPSHQLMRGGTIAEPREVCQLCRTEASVCGGGRPRGASFLCKRHPLFVQRPGGPSGLHQADSSCCMGASLREDKNLRNSASLLMLKIRNSILNRTKSSKD